MLSPAAAEIGAMLGQALSDTGRNQAALAIDLEMDESQVSRWLRGEAHVLVDRVIERADPVVVQAFGQRLAARCGVAVVPELMLEAIALLVRAVCERKPLRVGLPASAERRRVG